MQTNEAITPLVAPRARVRVLVISQSRLFAEALGAALANDAGIDVLGAAYAKRVDLARVVELAPDVLLLQGESGRADLAQLVSALHTAALAARIIVLTPSVTQLGERACLRAGALAYLSDDVSLDQVADAIRTVHGGGILLSAEALSALVREPAEPLTVSLRRREIDVLRVMASGCTCEEAAAQLAISPHTVRTHVKRAIQALGAHSKVEAIVIALRAGLIALPPRASPQPYRLGSARERAGATQSAGSVSRGRR